MGYLGRLGRAFVNLMLWNLTGLAPLMVLMLPMHLALYHYILREPIPVSQVILDLPVTMLGLLLLRRFASRKKRKRASQNL